MILKIMILAPVVIVSNDAFAQTLHDQTLYEVVKQRPGLGENSQIDVGDLPSIVGFDERRGTVYVANYDSNTVSVISGESNKKIKDIHVGEGPSAIGIDFNTDTVYVANARSNTVSVINAVTNEPVINATTNEPLKIPVGDGPEAIGVNEETNTIYVANYDSGTVSVISGESYTKIKDIHVGEGPSAIRIDEPYTVYVVNSDSGTVSVISGESNNTKIKDIPVGDGPSAIGASYERIYVVNSDSDTVSVINAVTNEPVINATTNEPLKIPVGEYPEAIGVIENRGIVSFRDTVYVANTESNNVSVISIDNNTKIKDIPVGDLPEDIGVLQTLDRYSVYVANYDSDTVSVINAVTNEPVINATTNEPLKIPVGDGPEAIGVNEETNTIYVANYDSGTVSVIDASANKVVAGVTFEVNPFNSGYIVCDDLTTPSSDDLTPPSPIGRYTYVYSGAECTAKPNEGFEFASWEENLVGNSTQPINASRSASPWDSFVLTIGAPFGYKPDRPEATLNVTKFGNFTANFKELPPPVPPEFWLQSYVLVGTVIAGLSIPSIVGWIKSKRDAKKLNYYHKQITSLYGDGKLDEDDIKPLDQLRRNVIDAYSQGKISEKHYESLRNEISILYEEIFRKKIDLLDNNNPSNNKATQEQLSEIRNEVENAYSKGKISETHYDLLNKAISNLESKEE
jgi:YVTN family beta-propeller protein